MARIGFIQSKYDNCIFYKGRMVYVLYTDDSILAGPDEKEITDAVKEMKLVGLNLTIDGNLEDFLGVNFNREANGTIKLLQPKLIKQVLNDMGNP